jgi:hypothetical protein
MKCPNCKKSLWFVRSFCPFCKTNIHAPPRPKSVTVLCWFFMVMSCATPLLLLVSPEFRTEVLRAGSRTLLQYIFPLVLPMLYLVLGGCTLVGHNWARWVLVVLLGVNAVRTAASCPDLKTVFVTVLLFVVAAYYLFRPLARPYFRGEASIATPPIETAVD